MKTNYTISIYSLVKAWDGSFEDPELLGNYNVWLEKEIQYNYEWINEQRTRTKIGSGYVIMPEEVNLVDCFILIDDTRYDVDDFSTIIDSKGKFHHMEFIYR